MKGVIYDPGEVALQMLDVKASAQWEMESDFFARLRSFVRAMKRDKKLHEALMRKKSYRALADMADLEE